MEQLSNDEIAERQQGGTWTEADQTAYNAQIERRQAAERRRREAVERRQQGVAERREAAERRREAAERRRREAAERLRREAAERLLHTDIIRNTYSITGGRKSKTTRKHKRRTKRVKRTRRVKRRRHRKRSTRRVKRKRTRRVKRQHAGIRETDAERRRREQHERRQEQARTAEIAAGLTEDEQAILDNSENRGRELAYLLGRRERLRRNLARAESPDERADMREDERNRLRLLRGAREGRQRRREERQTCPSQTRRCSINACDLGVMSVKLGYRRRWRS